MSDKHDIRRGGYAKWPRQYAAEIVRLPTREARQAALAEVPEALQPWVRDYVETAFHLRAARARRRG